MGFRMPRTEYNLPFENTALEGLHIRVEAMTMEERMHVLFDLSWSADDPPEVAKRKQDDRYALFLDHVIEWDLEDRSGQPVPVSRDSLFKACEAEQCGTIVGIWSSGRTIPVPLEPPSPDTSLAEIPMTVLESTPAPA